jgi:hypothetical protein
MAPNITRRLIARTAPVLRMRNMSNVIERGVRPPVTLSSLEEKTRCVYDTTCRVATENESF